MGKRRVRIEKVELVRQSVFFNGERPVDARVTYTIIKRGKKSKTRQLWVSTDDELTAYKEALVMLGNLGLTVE